MLFSKLPMSLITKLKLLYQKKKINIINEFYSCIK